MAKYRIVDKRKSLRQRECFNCGHKIQKGQDYLTCQISYDRRTITLNMCIHCPTMELQDTFIKKLNLLI